MRMDAPVKEIIETCWACGGEGWTEYSREEIMRFTRGCSLSMSKEIIREWREGNERLICTFCDGHGKTLRNE